MSARSPQDTVTQLVLAINRGDLRAATALYEPGACLVVQPGQIAAGRTSLREALAGFIALKPTLTSEKHAIVQARDVALYCSRWALRGTGPDGKEVLMTGSSADVLRRQADGRWLIAIDNPWGAGILNTAE